MAGIVLAAVGVTAAAAVRLELYPVVGVHSPYLPFILAVLVAARYGGWLPGLAATALSAITVACFFITDTDAGTLVGMSAFLLTGTLISLLVGRLRGAFLATARAEDALRRQNQLIDLSHDAIIAMDSERRILKWNAGAREMYGWTEREAAGKVIHELLQTSGEISITELTEILGREGQWNGELSHVTRDGRRIVVDSRHVVVRGGEHSRAAILAINRDITDRKRAEDAMRESERRYSALFANKLNAITHCKVVTDAHGKPIDYEIVQVNDAYEQVIGIRKEDTEGKRATEVFPGIEHFSFDYIGNYGKIALEGGELSFDVFFEPLKQWLSIYVYSPSHGEFVAISTDITERKQAEARLRESESFHRQMLESIPGMVFTTRPDGYCDYQSQQWVDYTGVPMKEHLGDGWTRLLHPDDRHRAFAAWRSAVEGRAPYDLEYRVRRYDGTYEWFKAIGRPIRDANGQIVRWFGVALNIQELKRAGQSMQDALDLRELAMETAKLGAWDYRFDSGDFLSDDQSSRIFGLPGQSQIAYDQIMARIHPDDRAAVEGAIRLAMAGADGGTYHREFRVIWPDGSVHWVAGHGRVVFESEGDQRRPLHLVGLNMEVTERRHAEERLRQTQKLESIGVLAGGVAHDFNNLLTVIMGSASSALEQCPSCEHSQAVLSASERAAYLTRQLLAYAGKGHFVTTKFDLSELVAKSKQLIAASVPKRVDVALNLAQDLPAIEGDPTRVEQILMNLAINAGEAIAPKTDGRIDIATGSCTVTPGIVSQHSHAFDAQIGPHVFLEVRDNGTGMDETTVQRIFDPFFSTKFTGRGLGLAAVHGIVRSSKGFIEVISNPGRGSTFRVFLPAAEHGRSTDAPAESAASVPRQELRGSATILVVDDEDMVRKLACMTLKGHGYEVLEAKDGRHALQVLADCASLPQIVVVDLAMPVMGGDELVPILKEKYPGLKIVVSSGYPEEEARAGFAAGAVAGFLQKPYTVLALLERVREMVYGSGPAPDGGILQFPRT